MRWLHIAWLKRLPAGGIVILTTVFSIVACGLWGGSIYLAWDRAGMAGINADMWAALGALSTAAAFSAVVGGGLMALAQLGEAVDSRNLTIFNDAFERLMSSDNIEARRWVYQDLPDTPEQGLASLSSQGREKVKLVLNSFDHLGFLIQQDWVSVEAEESIIKWVSPFVVKIWQKLGPYVDYEVTHRPEEPDYYEAARHLAQKCAAYRKKLLRRDPSITWRKDAL